MTLPSAKVSIEGGALGRVATLNDGVACLIVSGVAIPGNVTLDTPVQVFTTQEAVALGIDAAYDTANSTNAYKQISEFYEEAGEGQELWIVVRTNTATLASSAALLNTLQLAAEDRIKLFGICRKPDGAYTPTITNAIDADVTAAVTAAKLQAITMQARYTPAQILIEGRSFDDTAAATLPDQRAVGNTDGSKYVSVVIGNETAGEDCFVGRVLGRLASIPVQRSLGRVRSGALSIQTAFVGDQDVQLATETYLEQIHDKGYIIPRRHIGLDGYYLADDPTSDPITSDFAYINRTRTIEKARLIVRGVLLQELLEEVPVDPNTGRLSPAYVAELKQACDNALNLGLVDLGNASGAETIIDPTQNILSTDKLVATVKVIPVGTARYIEATVTFSNPATE